MDFLEYISYKLTLFNIFSDYEEFALFLYTYTKPNNTIEYDIVTGDFSQDNYLINDFIYIYSGYTEDYGINLSENRTAYELLNDKYNTILEKRLNYTVKINEPEIEITNDIRHLTSNITFTGTYDGEYSEANILDFDCPFYAIVKLKGIKKNNYYFDNYNNSLAKLLDCIDFLCEDRYESAFTSAYTALELLIRQTNNIKYLEPKDTKRILIENGFYKNQAKKIVTERNDSIHPSDYGFFENDDEIKISLKYVLKAYFYFFNKNCI